ncbi:MAG TPA: preprotein translocase subunit SecG [Cytophagales bacterium]|nr:preprotein translocase subunit SecG [Cytophagales bacterium]HAA19703.1 preprotein translocase subunit SecG [Cytophagales bacterium]HAP61636.1 preprotein translocase subunit SecG [Cytophagales bacterium]
MYVAIIILIIVLSFILIFAILAQNSKGGVGSQFGGSGASQVMGVKRTGDFLERATWSLGAAILVLTLSTSFMVDRTSTQGGENVNATRAQETVIPQGNLPASEGTPVNIQSDPSTTTDDSDLMNQLSTGDEEETTDQE